MNSAKKAKRVVPPTLVKGTRIRANAVIVRISSRGKVVSIIDSSTVIGLIIAKTPITRKIFAILDPITFPTAISLCPIFAAETVPASSGKLVPIATTLNPKMRGVKKMLSRMRRNPSPTHFEATPRHG